MEPAVSRTRFVLIAALTLALVAVPDIASAGAIKVSQIYFDPPGSGPPTNTEINKEFVVITNTGDRARNLTSWVLRDAQGNRFVFPEFRLNSGAIVRIRSGIGSNDRNDLFWGKSHYIWNNNEDTAYLKNRNGRVVSRCSYGPADTSPKVC